MSYKFIRETQLHLLMKVGNMIRIRVVACHLPLLPSKGFQCVVAVGEVCVKVEWKIRRAIGQQYVPGVV